MEELALGVTVDRYRLLARLGEGGQGDVWRAEDTLRPGVEVALKLISLPAASSSAADRLRREARLLARLEHPSLPRCHAIFEDPRKDIFGFALDLVDGVALSELQGTPALSVDQRVQILLHIAGALRFVHQAGLVHRDVKASNVVIDDAFFARPADPSTVKLLDFGIAVEQDNPRRLTAPGSVIGTISHLAPELLDQGFWREKADGPERDLFAFGVLAFEIFRGAHPTGLSPESTHGDYLVAYRDHAAGGAEWLAGVRGDLLEMLYRRSLALRAGERATSDEAIVLLQQAQHAVRAGHTTTGFSLVSTTSPTRVVTPTPSAAVAPISIQNTSRSWAFTPGPPRSESATSTEPPRSSSIAAVTAPVALPTPWPPSAAPLVHPVPAPVTPSSKARGGVGRSSTLVGVLVGGGAAIAFVLAFALKSDSEEASEQVPFVFSSASAPAAPTPLPLSPSPPPGRSPSPPPPVSVSPQPTWGVAPNPLFPPDDPPPVVAVNCPRGTVLIPDGPNACIDLDEVTVAAYTQSGALLSDEAFWLGADAGSLAEQSANCAGQRGGSGREPVNCVSWSEAKAYCEKRHQRLPTLDELDRARAVIKHCTRPSTVCPVFEWTADAASGRSTRKTRGPSFRIGAVNGSNQEVARNDDLGFRCVSDPL